MLMVTTLKNDSVCLIRDVKDKQINEIFVGLFNFHMMKISLMHKICKLFGYTTSNKGRD